MEWLVALVRMRVRGSCFGKVHERASERGRFFYFIWPGKINMGPPTNVVQ